MHVHAYLYACGHVSNRCFVCMLMPGAYLPRDTQNCLVQRMDSRGYSLKLYVLLREREITRSRNVWERERERERERKKMREKSVRVRETISVIYLHC